jgi:hypothetical protein
MLAGLLSGMYSSIYIATPIMLWVAKRQRHEGAPTALATAGSGGGASPSAPVTYVPESEGGPSVADQVEAARERRERKNAGPKQRRR